MKAAAACNVESLGCGHFKGSSIRRLVFLTLALAVNLELAAAADSALHVQMLHFRAQLTARHRSTISTSWTCGPVLDHLVQWTFGNTTHEGKFAMKAALAGIGGLEAIRERNQAELIRARRKRDRIVIEKSPDQLDEIQEASERDLTIRNAERESNLSPTCCVR